MDRQNNIRHQRSSQRHDNALHEYGSQFSREDDLLTEITEGSGNTLTCPSCRISIIPTRIRSMCPFCGSFYDPAIEGDVTQRIHQHHHGHRSGNKSSILGSHESARHHHDDDLDRLESGDHRRSRSYTSSQVSQSPPSSRRSDVLRLPRIVGFAYSVVPKSSLGTYPPFIAAIISLRRSYRQ